MSNQSDRTVIDKTELFASKQSANQSLRTAIAIIEKTRVKREKHKYRGIFESVGLVEIPIAANEVNNEE